MNFTFKFDYQDILKFLQENIRDFHVDNIAYVYPEDININKGEVKITTWDSEMETRKVGTLGDAAKAFELLVEHINNGQIDKANHNDALLGKRIYFEHLPNPILLMNIGNWDIEVYDAFWQLFHNGKILYG